MLTVTLEIFAKQSDYLTEKGGLILVYTFCYNTVYPVLIFNYFLWFGCSGIDNNWIIKPWNRARGIDMYITNDVNKIVRLQETRPKVT